jgi:hypothetical protein
MSHGPYWYATFARHISHISHIMGLGQGDPFITPAQSSRVTELALRIQRALDDGDTVDLRPSQMAHRS